MIAITEERERAVSVSLFLPVRTRERLVELARQRDRSVSAEIRRAIARHLEEASRADVQRRRP